MKQDISYTVFVLLCLLLVACGTAEVEPLPEEVAPVSEGSNELGEVEQNPAEIVNATATTNPESAVDLPYHNDVFGFRFVLPATWAGYQATQNDNGNMTSICFAFANHGPVCVLQVDVYDKVAWDDLTMVPADYYLGENEQYVFAAGPYPPQCVQLDDFQCARYQEIPGILAGFSTE